jgi:hypothetical protein
MTFLGNINSNPRTSAQEDLNSIMRLADHIRDIEIDRHELQVALDEALEELEKLKGVKR